MVVNKNNILKGIIELKTDIGRLNLDDFKISKREKILRQTKYAETNLIVGKYTRYAKNKN